MRSYARMICLVHPAESCPDKHSVLAGDPDPQRQHPDNPFYPNLTAESAAVDSKAIKLETLTVPS